MVRNLRLGTLGLLVAALLLLGTPGQAQERGVTPTEILLGSTVPLSGPAAFWGIGVGRGMEVYLALLNAQGGINGRRLTLVLRDDAYLPPRAVANVRELVERVGVFAIVGMIGTANAFAARDYIVESQTLWITPTTSDIWAGFRGRKYLFVTYPSYVHEARILTEFAAQRLNVRRIAVFYQNDLYGQQLLLGVKRASTTARVRVVAQTSYEVTDADVSAQAVRLRESGADAVFLAATPRHGALIVREMARLGFRPQLLATFTLGDPIMFQLAGDAWNDVYSTAYFPLPGHGDARVDALLERLGRAAPELVRQNPYNVLAGVSFIEPLLEAIRRAGREVTKDRVVAELERLRNWDGEVIRGVTFGPERRQGITRLYIVRATNRQYVKVTDWISYPAQY